MPDRRALVGHRYELPGLRVEPDSSDTYGAVIGDDLTRHAERGTASPFYAVALVAPLWRAIYQAPELDTSDQRVLHAEQRMLIHRDLRHGETVTAQALVNDVIGFGFNDAAVIRSRLVDAEHRPVISMESTLSIQGSSGYPPTARRGAQPSGGEIAARLSREFDVDLPRQYAEAADDHNPLHLDDDAARAAGHPGRIVHGMCTLATGITALVNKLRERPEDRLHYLRARFSRPVPPGGVVDYTARATGAAGTYLATAGLAGRPVLKGCWFRIAGRS